MQAHEFVLDECRLRRELPGGPGSFRSAGPDDAPAYLVHEALPTGRIAFRAGTVALPVEHARMPDRFGTVQGEIRSPGKPGKNLGWVHWVLIAAHGHPGDKRQPA